jgi:hypothetical protein
MKLFRAIAGVGQTKLQCLIGCARRDTYRTGEVTTLTLMISAVSVVALDAVVTGVPPMS